MVKKKSVGWAPPTIPWNIEMPIYRRALIGGGTYFFTVVTFERQRFFANPQYLTILREIVAEVRKKLPFAIDAWVVLPDHMHCIWTLPPDDADFSKRWGLIKATFSKRIRLFHHQEAFLRTSRFKHREANIWQRRFWEHLIRDEDDFIKHADYVHFNPVKHGLVDKVKDWPYSTFHRYVKNGIYSADWGEMVSLGSDGNFGE
jgi:putative transposase